MDIEKDPFEQGFPPHSFDVVILARSLHKTRDVGASLGHVKKLLRTEGLLMLLELPPTGWFDLVFGLAPEWRDCSQDGLRIGHPLLSSQSWCDHLRRAGFHEVSNLIENPIPPLESLVLAQGPAVSNGSQPRIKVGEGGSEAVAKSGSWLVLADRGALGEQLKERLAQRGEDAILVHQGPTFRRQGPLEFEVSPEESEQWRDLHDELREEISKCRGIIHLWTLDAPEIEGRAPASAEAVLDGSCLGLIHLLQVLSRNGSKVAPRLWIVTRGAQQLGSQQSEISLAQAPIWGLGRVVMQEHPELRCTLVDLSPKGPGGQLDEVESLLNELGPEGDQEIEQEILLRQGSRYVHRIVRAALEETTSPDPESSFRLETTQPGLLQDLVIKRVPRQAPGPEEIEIEVAAAGLNFKDLMISMGLLPYEALEGGYAGQSLGLECSGVVAAVGDGVQELQVGDEVMAVGRHCLGRYVTVPAVLAVRKPPTVSFEEAATVPVTFITAHYALHYLGRLREGERVLIHGAAGGVGLAAIQTVENARGEVFATAGSAEKRDYLRLLGVRHVMDSRSLVFAEEVMRLTDGQGVDLVLNCLSGDFLRKSLGVLRRFGRFLDISRRDMVENSRLDMQPFLNNLSYFAIYLDQLWQGDRSMAQSLFAELTTKLEERTVRPLPYRVFPVSRVVEAFQYLQQSRHIGKVIISMKDPHCRVLHEVREQVQLSAQASYLITGGSSGFGLEVARWMVERGARHLVLASRTGTPRPEAEKTLGDLGRTEARVELAQVDITDAGQVSEMLSRIEQTGPPLRGIVHAAAFYEDSMLLQLGRDSLRRVMDPKILGAWNLHALSRDQPLDFFVLFSSVAAMVGNPGQGSYCAANAFLEALADHRTAEGLPALAVSWGAISDVGYLARRGDIADVLSKHGFPGMTSKIALQVLGRAMQTKRSHLGVFRADWGSWRRNRGQASLVLSHLLPSQVEAHRDGYEDLLESLLAARPEQQLELLQARLLEELGKILGVSSSKVDPEKPIIELGLDSLMAVELRSRIEGTLGVQFPLMEILEGQTVFGLSRTLVDQFGSGQKESGEDPDLPLSVDGGSRFDGNNIRGSAAD